MTKTQLRLASELDWPIIVYWRNQFLEKMGLDNRAQKGLNDCVWVVWGDIPKSCVSYVIDNENKILWMFDFYMETKTAGYQIMNFVHKFANDNFLEIRGNTPLANFAYREVLAKLGYEEFAIEFRRKPNVCI